MKKNIKPGIILPQDTFFYTISLESGQGLTREMLELHYPVPKGRKVYMGNHVEYKGFKNALISVEAKLSDGSENMLYLHVGLTELDIACTCGMPGEKLCFHAFMCLHNLAWFRRLELEDYYWPGLTDDDKIKDKFLTTEVTKNWIKVKPKEKYGNIFKSSIGFAEREKFSLITPAKTLASTVGGQGAIAYCMAYNLGEHHVHLPILMACLGVTSKQGNDIVSFKQFNHQKKLIPNVSYTANQQMLNEISLQQHDIAKRQYGMAGEEKKQEAQNLKQEMLTLWEQAIPILLNERYNYSYYTYWLRYLRTKPRKSDMRDCKYSLDRPVLSFQLKMYQDYFALEAIMTVNGSTLHFKNKPPLFVFDKTTGLIYLMSSVQDDDVLRWMLSHNNRLTILKQHFKEFQNSFLGELSSYYSVNFIDPQSKKIVPYDFKAVLDHLS